MVYVSLHNERGTWSDLPLAKEVHIFGEIVQDLAGVTVAQDWVLVRCLAVTGRGGSWQCKVVDPDHCCLRLFDLPPQSEFESAEPHSEEVSANESVRATMQLLRTRLLLPY